MTSDQTTFWAAVAGAIVGGLFTLGGALMAHQNQKSNAKDAEDKLIKGYLQSVHDEIETVFDRYQESMGARVESLGEGQPLLFYYPLVSDFFTVYNANAFLLGRIPDNDLRKQIIKAYTLGKGLVDSYRLNNDLVQKFERSIQIHQETNSDVHKTNAQNHHNALVEYAKILKQAHGMVKAEVSALLRMLRKKGVLAEQQS